MKFRTLVATALAATLLAGSASAITVYSSDAPPIGTYFVGDTFTIDASFDFTCPDDGTQAATYTATLVDGLQWLNASEVTVEFDPSDCAPSVTPGLPDGPPSTSEEGSVNYTGIMIDVEVTGLAYAYENFTIQPGLLDANGDVVETTGGSFIIHQGYVGDFTAPTFLGFDIGESGRLTTVVPFTMAHNYPSALDFHVTEFLFDGAPAPSGATISFAGNDSVFSPLNPKVFTPQYDVAMQFDVSGVGESDAMAMDEHDDEMGEHDESDGHHDEMDCGDAGSHVMPNGDVMCNASSGHDGHTFYWKTATATVQATLASNEDPTDISPVHLMEVTFTNTNPATQAPDEPDPADDTFNEDDNPIPATGALAAIAALGVIAVLRRRN